MSDSTLTLFQPQVNSGAQFSPDRMHRLKLWRIWDESLPLVMFVGLNPSTANENEADPTIRRVIGFAKSWGFGGVYMMNLFTFVTPYPEDLVKDDNESGNMARLVEVGDLCSRVILAWGNFPYAIQRGKKVSALFPEAHCLGLNKNGSPKHPLYQPANVVTQLFNQ